MDMIFDAMNLAICCHDGQRRKGLDQPYVMHPVRACQFLTRHGVIDPTILSATLLHDAKEDCNEGPIRTWELICHYANGKVASIVDEVSDDRSGALTQVERKRAQVAHAPELSFAATLVKVADMYDNLKSLTVDGWQLPPGWGEDRVRGYAAWKRTVYDSGKFGMRLCEMGYQSMFDEIEKLFEHFLAPRWWRVARGRVCGASVLSAAVGVAAAHGRIKYHFKRSFTTSKKAFSTSSMSTLSLSRSKTPRTRSCHDSSRRSITVIFSHA